MKKQKRLVSISKKDVQNSIDTLKLIHTNFSKVERLNKLYADKCLPMNNVDSRLIQKGFFTKEKNRNQYSLNTAQIRIVVAAIQLLKI